MAPARVENVAQPVDRQPRLVELLPHLRKAQHRRADPGRQHLEGDQFADGEIAGNHQPCAKIERRRDHQLVDRLHRLAGVVVQIEDAEAGGDIAGELLLPASLHLRLDRHGFQRLDARDAFDKKRMVFRAAPEFFVEAAAKQRRSASGKRDIEGKDARTRKVSVTE